MDRLENAKTAPTYGYSIHKIRTRQKELGLLAQTLDTYRENILRRNKTCLRTRVNATVNAANWIVASIRIIVAERVKNKIGSDTNEKTVVV